MLIMACVMYCGDAMCTIAAQASSGTDFFITDMTRGFLSYQQRNFAGNKHSDHIAALNAFQTWEEVRNGGGEMAEMNFCEQKGLNSQTLRTTYDAKNQLRDLMISQGFPEECMTPQVFNFSGNISGKVE